MPLNPNKTAFLAANNGVAIRQIAGGSLAYDASLAYLQAQTKFNTLRTPRGGQYQIQLPDGTKAWLNAASSVKFPMVFNNKERTVEIEGEVYFEVAPDKHKPFKVISSDQIIEVLGTHFNVNSYPNEIYTKTTLLEGSVCVSSTTNKVLIKLGEATLFNKQTKQLSVHQADLEEVKAWRNGYFQFQNEDLKSIMRKLSRWYDIDVAYSDDFVEQRFTGSVSRFAAAETVLQMIAYTGTVHFSTKGRRITVMP